MAIDVARDQAGVEMALRELCEEDFAFSRVRRNFEQSDGENRDHILSSLPNRLLSPGYYKWASYVRWLDERIKAGMHFARLTDAEMEGLVALARARGGFEYAHPTCACGAYQETRFATKCHACGLEFHRNGGR